MRGYVVRTVILVGTVLVTPVAASAQGAGPFAAAGEVTRVEIVRIGGMDARAEHTFSSIRDVALITSGRIAVVDGASQEIRVFDRDGAYVTKMGGEGDGPGEFRAIRDVVVLPDGRLLAWDISRRRVTTFDPSGGVAETFLVDGSPLDALFPRFAGAFSGGRVLIRDQINTMGLRSEPPAVRRDSITLLVLDAAGPVAGHRWIFEGPERDFYNSEGTWGFDEPLFTRELTHAVVRDTLVVAHTDSVHLRRFVGADEIEPLSLPTEPRRVTRDDVEAERAVRLAELEETAERRARRGSADLGIQIGGALLDMTRRERERLEELRAFETFPAMAGLKASDDGHLWLEMFPDRVRGVVEWYRLTLDGRVLGRITLPIAERLMAMTDQRVATVIEDDYGVETVVVYAVRGW